MVDPALLLGAAVVKTACKVWLKDNQVAADAAVGVAEVIQAHVSEVRERRRVQRLFEDLEERVADNVLNNLGTEFRDVPPNEREAAALAVADTLDKAKLTKEQLLTADLDAGQLLRTVRPLGNRFVNDLSDGAAELYGRVLHDCCAYVVEVADSLPGFEIGVFSEILVRQKEIVRRIEQRFDSLPMRLGGAGAETFEPAYLRLVANQLDKVELFGVTVSDRVDNYPLSVAYVSLSVSTSGRLEDIAFSGLDDKEPVKSECTVTSLEDALGGTRRAFIRGEAGSGKTTLLQWLAVRCGRREFEGPLRDWNGCVPLLIRLRRYSGKELPRPEEFLHDLGAAIAHTMPLEWVHDLLRAGRAVVLVDGVDELSERQRRRAREWLRQLVIAFPNARYVVTSRPAAAAEDWLVNEVFDVLEIQPMTLADVDAFVDHWHAAMAEGVSTTTERERIESSRTELMRTIRSHRHLRMLAVSPLMTALICALHLDRRMQLPHDRMELYSIALEMLLERRDKEREIQSSAVSISRADKTLILEDLAYWLVRNGRSSAPQDRVIERLQAKLAGLHRVQATAHDVLKHLLDRSGLLRMPVDGQIDFVHKTFQEFLAARAAVAADDIGVLVRNAHDDQWREVVLMAVGHARAGQTDEILHMMLTRARKEREHRYVLQALAVGCIQHAPELSPGLQTKIQGVAKTLLPPKGIRQGLALAGVGDLALELLSSRTSYSHPEAIATTRMASVIGGEHALRLIGDLAPKVGRVELERAWSKFDPERFAQEVLARVSNKVVKVSDPSLLVGLKHLPATRALRCHFVHGYGTIEYISDLPNLLDLSVADPELRSIDPIENHPTLRSVFVSGRPASLDLSPVAKSKSINRFDCNLASIRGLEQLKMLAGVGQLGFSDAFDTDVLLPYISEGVLLERIDIWRADHVSSLDSLIASPRLAELNFLLLGKAESLTSIAGIDRWAGSMTGLYLDAEKIADLENLARMPLLEFVNLNRTPVESLEFARSLSNLRILHIFISGQGRLDLTPLCELSTLGDLYISGDQPVDVSGLADAANLTVHIHGRPRPVFGKGRLPSTVTVRRHVDS